MRPRLTQADQLLLTAKELSDMGKSPFTKESLVLSAWTRWPQTFGLEGFQLSHPDTHLAYSALMGKKGVVGLGLMVNNNGQYQLTVAGLHRAKQTESVLNHDLKEKARDKLIPTQEEQQLLIRLIGDPAHSKIVQGLHSEVTAVMGLGFWDINGDVGQAVTTKIKSQSEMLVALSQLTNTNMDFVMDNGLVADWRNIAELIRTEQWLANRFRHHVRILERRVKC